MTPARTQLRAGRDCTAWIAMQPDGTGTVHVIRQGHAPLTVFGCEVRRAKTNTEER